MNKQHLLIFVLGLFTGYLLTQFLNTSSDNKVVHQTALVKPQISQAELNDERLPVDECVVQSTSTQAQPSNKQAERPSAIDMAISISSEEEITQFVQQQGILDADSLEQITDVRAAAQRLTDVVLGLNSDDEVEMLNHGPSRVYFSDGTHSEPGYANQSQFDADIQQITASFETGTDHGHKLLVKWLHVPSNQLIAFKNVPIKSADTLHFIKVNKAQWQRGQYRVEIYAISDTFPLLSTGMYDVEDISN